jgi:hypothetical protein
VTLSKEPQAQRLLLSARGVIRPLQVTAYFSIDARGIFACAWKNSTGKGTFVTVLELQ